MSTDCPVAYTALGSPGPGAVVGAATSSGRASDAGPRVDEINTVARRPAARTAAPATSASFVVRSELPESGARGAGCFSGGGTNACDCPQKGHTRIDCPSAAGSDAPHFVQVSG